MHAIPAIPAIPAVQREQVCVQSETIYTPYPLYPLYPPYPPYPLLRESKFVSFVLGHGCTCKCHFTACIPCMACVDIV